MKFVDDEQLRIAGRSSIAVTIDPYHGSRASLLYPESRAENWSLSGKKKLAFWLKTINPNLPDWQYVNPVVTLHKSDKQFFKLTPVHDLLSQPTYNEARDGWRYFKISLAGDTVWKSESNRDAAAPADRTVQYLTIGLDS